MGMYTEIFVRCQLKQGTPESVIELLQCMLGEKEEPKELPDHPLFQCGRWTHVLSCGSYYHQPRATGSLWFEMVGESYYLCARADLKNYEGEIGKFFDWLMPYIDERPGQFVGYQLYEEDDTPTLYHVPGGVDD